MVLQAFQILRFRNLGVQVQRTIRLDCILHSLHADCVLPGVVAIRLAGVSGV